ncbi:MAG: acetyl-CoA C-acetyltransferase [Lentisphaerae bacterium]|nr:acetyl-CoA C-acetyltransferase [Lentisphaerota bacterium]
MRKVLLSGAARTAIGDLNGALSGVGAVQLGVVAASTALERSGLSGDKVEEAVFGNVLQAGQGQNPARQVAMGAGIPASVPAFTVNKVCGSGLKALELGWQSIMLGRADAVLAGGMESMSRAPYLLPAMRAGSRLGDAKAPDSIIGDGLTDVFGKYHMAITAENVAAKYGITRGEQDEFALESQRKYAAAASRDLFAAEIAAVVIKQKKAEARVDKDEHPRPDTTLEKLARLPPAFKPDGTVTAGNASGINDGAAAAVLAAEGSAAAAGLDLGRTVRVRGFAAAGCDPAEMGLGPVYAVRKLLRATGLSAGNVDLWELNEAFAAQSLAVLRDLALDPARVNVNGGAIALGHPIGASGARIVVTLVHEMKRRQSAVGVAALCIGGGMGLAVMLENM